VRLIAADRGRRIKTTGDGVLATFDGPGRAIRCALAMRSERSPLGIRIRAGMDTGEPELCRGDIGGTRCTVVDECPRKRDPAKCWSLERCQT
jgi:class 3 adenylate cyclase